MFSTATRQSLPQTVTKEKVAEIAADFMTTYYGVQVGALETQELRQQPTVLARVLLGHRQRIFTAIVLCHCLAGCDLEAKTTLGWRHAEGDTTPLAREAFDGGDMFAIAGAPLSRNAGIVELGLETSLTASIRLDVDYSGQFAHDISDNGLTGTVSVQF